MENVQTIKHLNFMLLLCDYIEFMVDVKQIRLSFQVIAVFMVDHNIVSSCYYYAHGRHFIILLHCIDGVGIAITLILRVITM